MFHKISLSHIYYIHILCFHVNLKKKKLKWSFLPQYFYLWIVIRTRGLLQQQNILFAFNLIGLCFIPLLPPFGASILEPGLHLRVGHLQSLGEGGSLRGRQVLLSVEAFLQLTDLQPSERSPRLFLLRGRPVLVWMTYATGHSEGWEGHWTETGRERRWQERRRQLKSGSRTLSKKECKAAERAFNLKALST